MSYTYSEYKRDLERPQPPDGKRYLAPVFHPGDEMFHEDYGFGIVQSCVDEFITAIYEDGVHQTDYDNVKHGRFETYDEAMKYHDHSWPVTLQYHDWIVPELKLDNGAVLYPYLTYREPFLKEARIEIFRSELEMINFEGISLSLEENRYLPYWRMTQRLTREEFDAIINLLKSPYTDPIIHWKHYPSGWQFCTDEWYDTYDYRVPSMPNYDFDTIN